MKNRKYGKCRTTHKRRFRSEVDAKMALAMAQWADTGEKRFYSCPFCNGFHLTSQEQRTEKVER